MTNKLDATGLTTATKAELITNLTSAFQEIYGADINLASDTPDGQLMNIFAQTTVDTEDLLTQVYNSFDPDNAIGNVLDQRVAINFLQRQGGTYTVTPITVVTSVSVNLPGLDQTATLPYTVADNAGNQWFLITSQNGVTGSNIFSFRAATPGALTTIPNTITVQVTVILGVTSVNNPSSYTSLGTNEETDAALKLRRAKSPGLVAQGVTNSLFSALGNINGITSQFIYENFTAITNADGVPGHSIWVIVAGSAAAADIAQAIFSKRNLGCGMFGSQSYALPLDQGGTFTVFWDDVAPVNLFMSFTATSINGTTAPAVGSIRTGLPSIFVPGVYQNVNINELGTFVQDIDSNTLVTSAYFGTGQTQTFTLSANAASGACVVTYAGNNSSSISWNDSAATIQTKMRLVSGLSTIVVTGAFNAGPVVFDLTSIVDVQGLLYLSTNTLLSAGSAAITITYNPGITSNSLLPPSKTDQFIVASANIIILPMLLLPALSTTTQGVHTTFVGYGGYGSYTYSILTNNSGGSINSSTGVYTAGSSVPGTDTIKVVDVYGNSQTTTILVGS